MFNQTTIIGRLGRDPETKQTNGQTFVKLNIAVDNGYFDQTANQWVDRTAWYNCTIWREVKSTKMKKGAIVLVTGQLTPKIYRNNDGVSVIDMAMKVESYRVIVGTANENNSNSPVPNSDSSSESNSQKDDLPF